MIKFYYHVLSPDMWRVDLLQDVEDDENEIVQIHRHDGQGKTHYFHHN